MRIIDQLITAISPSLLIESPDWQRDWRAEEFNRFSKNAKYFAAGIAVISLAHFFLIDLPENKQPIDLWRFYRFSIATVFSISFGLTYTSWFKRSILNRLPLALCVAYLVYMQGQSMIWREKVPFFYVPLLAVFGIMSLRLSTVASLLVYTVVLGIARESFFCRPAETHHMVSASLVGATVITVLRTRLKLDLENFLLIKKNAEAQKKIIAGKIALTEQLRAFMSREISSRAEVLMSQRGMTPLEAIDEVLRPKKCLAAVMHSDIRGFTGLTKLGDEALLAAVTPAQKACTNAIEDHCGIPRLVGDLVYSYFDRPNPIENLKNALLAAFSLCEVTSRLNASVASSEFLIKRYAIISFGPVISGNIGGTEGARDISVLGNAANLPSRLDPLTKEIGLQEYLKDHPIILSCDAAAFLRAILPSIKISTCKLSNLGLTVKDFPEEQEMHFLAASPENKTQLEGLLLDHSTGALFIRSKYASLIQSDDQNSNQEAA